MPRENIQEQPGTTCAGNVGCTFKGVSMATIIKNNKILHKQINKHCCTRMLSFCVAIAAGSSNGCNVGATIPSHSGNVSAKSGLKRFLN